MLPGQVWREGGKEVVDGPGDDHVIIEADETLTDEVDKAETFEEWREVGVQGDRALGRVLSDLQLQQEGWDADDCQHEEVGDEEGPTSILEAQVGEPPHIP